LRLKNILQNLMKLRLYVYKKLQTILHKYGLKEDEEFMKIVGYLLETDELANTLMGWEKDYELLLQTQTQFPAKTGSAAIIGDRI